MSAQARPWAPRGRPSLTAIVSATSARLDRAPIGPCGNAGAEGEDRNVLARVIEAPERRVVSVVGGDDAKVGGAHRRFNGAEPSIEGFETGRITRDIAAMSPFGVEIDQIDEDQAALRRRRERIEEKIDIAVVALALALVPGVAMGEDVADLADRDDGAASVGRPAAEYCPPAEAWRNPCDWRCAQSPWRSRRGKDARSRDRCSMDRTAGARSGKDHKAAQVRKPARARRSGAPSRRTCSRWVSAFAGAPRHNLRSPRCPKHGGWREFRRACLRQSAPRSAPPERRERSPGNSPSRSRPACRRAPNGRRACPCRAKSRSHNPIGRAAREAQSQAARGQSKPSLRGQAQAPRGAAISAARASSLRDRRARQHRLRRYGRAYPRPRRHRLSRPRRRRNQRNQER